MPFMGTNLLQILQGVTMELDNTPILNGLYKYMKENRIQFHMPGHKGNINNFEELNFIKEKLFEIDKTEVPGLDNLHIPEGMIKEAQILSAEAYKAAESYFLINGSTCGIYSMILGVTKPGDRILIQRNCHRAVFMAALLGGLEAVYIDPDLLLDFNIPGGISVERVKELLETYEDIKAIVLTNPSYYGICSDLEGIVKQAHSKNVLVLVDEAHGAHLPFHNALPRSAMECGADASVVSIHKSLPALTQASLMNVSDRLADSGIKFMLRVFQSTSPSYVLMASIDAARSIMQHSGEKLLDKLLLELQAFRAKVNTLKCFKILSQEHIGKASISDVDLTKIVIASCFGGRELDEKLRTEYNIQVEMSDINNVVLITGIGDNTDSFDSLYKALYHIDKKQDQLKERNMFYTPNQYEICMNMKDAYYANKTKVAIGEAVGKISGEMVVPYPPGIPILLPGERITEAIFKKIMLLKKKSIPINGTEDAVLDTIMIIAAKN